MSKKIDIIVKVDEKAKRDIRHSASASSESDVKSKTPAATAVLASDVKTVDVNAKGGSSLAQEQPTPKTEAQISHPADLSEAGKKGNAVKGEKKRAADIVVQHKFK